jgi:hypothetical protein
MKQITEEEKILIEKLRSSLNNYPLIKEIILGK